jgi:ankyrin repeat protein
MRRVSVFIFSLLVLLSWSSQAAGQDLIQAIRAEDEAAARRLLSQDPSLVNVADDRQCTPLHFAVQGNRADLVEMVLEVGADPNALDSDGDSPLTWAVLAGLEEMWTLLLNHGVEVDLPNLYGRTPLHQVARETGNEGAARALLEHGANPDAQDRFGATGLNLAAWRGFRGVVDALLDHGADLGVGGPLARPNTEFAAQKGLDRLFEGLLDAGVDLGIETGLGGTLLHAAAEGGSEEIVGPLLEQGFQVTALDRYGWTPLHYAAERGRTEVTELLISHGADVNVATTGGHTPLSLTDTYSKEEEARLLEAHGAVREAETSQVLEGPWLGQEPPGSVARVFAQDIVSSSRFEHGTVAFSPDGREAFWESSFMPQETGYSQGRILTSRMEEGTWTRPEYASFSTAFMLDDDVPFFHPDGSRLYFISGRSKTGENEPHGERIWYVDRTAAGWGEPRIIEGGPNLVGLHWQFAVAANGNIYHSANLPSGLGGGDIYVSRFRNGAYLPPEHLGPVINSEGSEGSPFIAPDESYLIVTSGDRPGSMGATDLYISVKTPEGEWTPLMNMGPSVNTSTYDMCPMVSGDGRFLFWNGRPEGDADNYWIDAGLIQELKGRALGG